jgi:hypothetical protein
MPVIRRCIISIYLSGPLPQPRTRGKHLSSSTGHVYVRLLWAALIWMLMWRCVSGTPCKLIQTTSPGFNYSWSLLEINSRRFLIGNISHLPSSWWLAPTLTSQPQSSPALGNEVLADENGFTESWCFSWFFVIFFYATLFSYVNGM